jgi:hypothetical protein
MTGVHKEEFSQHPIYDCELDISVKDFYSDFMTKHRPCIFRNLTKEWPAYELWKDRDYLKSKAGDDIVQVEK